MNRWHLRTASRSEFTNECNSPLPEQNRCFATTTTVNLGAALSVALIRSDTYWRDSPGESSLEFNYTLVEHGFVVQHVLVPPYVIYTSSSSESACVARHEELAGILRARGPFLDAKFAEPPEKTYLPKSVDPFQHLTALGDRLLAEAVADHIHP